MTQKDTVFVKFIKSEMNFNTLLNIPKLIIMDLEYCPNPKNMKCQSICNISAKQINNQHKKFDIFNQWSAPQGLKKKNAINSIVNKAPISWEEIQSNSPVEMVNLFYSWLNKPSNHNVPIVGWGIDGDMHYLNNMISNYIKPNFYSIKQDRLLYDLSKTFSKTFSKGGTPLKLSDISNVLNVAYEDTHVGNDDVNSIHEIIKKLRKLSVVINK